MHDINLSDQRLKPARHDVVMQIARSQRPQKSIRDTEVPPGQRWTKYNIRACNQFLNGSGTHKNFRARRRQAAHLLPGSVADSPGTKFVRKAIEHPYWLTTIH